MRGIKFEGFNVNYGAPVDWNEERDGPCDSLPVLRQLEGSLITCTSVWELTPEERAEIAAGANIALSVVGRQVPVLLYTTQLQALPEEKPQPDPAG